MNDQTDCFSMGRMLSYADLDAISAEGGRDTPFKIQMQIAEVTFFSTRTVILYFILVVLGVLLLSLQ